MWERLTRRAFVREIGTASFGLVVLGTAACTSSEPESGGTSSATPSEPIASTAGSGLGRGGAWHRASFGFVSAWVLVRDGVATVVDTGTGDVGAITDALDAGGVGWSAVSDIILTHKHPDHVGGLENARKGNSDARVHAGAADIDAIGADGLLPVVNGDRINGLHILATPGHTPGHVSVLDDAAGVLVAGDALNGADGGVVGANPDFSEDMAAANESIDVLSAFDFDTILFGHGDPVNVGGAALVRALVA